MTLKNSKIQDPLDTPMMRQYLEVKEKYPDAILFFRMGDFYEMFLDDAKEAAPLLDVALTKRQNQIPMAGIPYHSADTYIARLISAGKKVAIAEQTIDPENPKLMRRMVRRVVSSGTLVEESLLSSAHHNYLMAVLPGEGFQSFAVCDVSTGDFSATQLDGDAVEIRNFYYLYTPGEILVPSEKIAELRKALPEASDRIVPVEDWKASPSEGLRRIGLRFNTDPAGLGYDESFRGAAAAVSMILHYIDTSFPDGNIRLDPPVFRHPGSRYMRLDAETIRNLELVQNTRDSTTDRTLFAVLDRTQTNAGKRFLKEAVLHPLIEKKEILERQSILRAFISDSDFLKRVSENLSQVSDLDRIMSRITSGRAAPRDFTGIMATIDAGLALKKLTDSLSSAELQGLINVDGNCYELRKFLEETLLEELPAVFGNGPFLREGMNEKLDKSRKALSEGSRWILDFEIREKKRTGISTLKVKYNKVVGYFIEMSKNQAAMAPEGYRKKQTLVGNERFTCPELDDLEDTIAGANAVISEIENEYLEKLCERVTSTRSSLRNLMKGIASLDFYQSLASAAVKNRWILPEVSDEGRMEIYGGRHPVVESYLPPGERFIPNDLVMDSEERTFAVLTGPNMAGKSTYIRQAGLIQILMQIGSAVPASRCKLPVSDTVYSRIGASDNLTRGESTFYVEMLETARILNRCTDNSLVIMDEVGRGTSTYDGLSIAWSVVEYLSPSGKKQPRCLFATHYHELTELADLPGVFNLTMEVEDSKGRVVFLHTVREGHADRSYGIHVARLAGIPEDVILRAEEKLLELEEGALTKQNKRPKTLKPSKKGLNQPGLF